MDITEPVANLTFAIIKTDAVGAGHTGKTIDRIIAGGFRIRMMTMISRLGNEGSVGIVSGTLRVLASEHQ